MPGITVDIAECTDVHSSCRKGAPTNMRHTFSLFPSLCKGDTLVEITRLLFCRHVTQLLPDGRIKVRDLLQFIVRLPEESGTCVWR